MLKANHTRLLSTGTDEDDSCGSKGLKGGVPKMSSSTQSTQDCFQKSSARLGANDSLEALKQNKNKHSTVA
jgi:hypothetical protein